MSPTAPTSCRGATHRLRSYKGFRRTRRSQIIHRKGTRNSADGPHCSNDRRRSRSTHAGGPPDTSDVRRDVLRRGVVQGLDFTGWLVQNRRRRRKRRQELGRRFG